MPPEAASLLEAAGIDAGYGTMQVLWGVDLDVRAGETVLLLGANGAGKTTFLKSLVGLIEARHGSIRLGGEDVTRMRSSDRMRLGMTYMSELAVFPDLSIEENIRVGAQALGHADPGARVFLGTRFAATGGVRVKQIFLKPLRLFRSEHHIGQFTDAGIHAVHRLPVAEQPPGLGAALPGTFQQARVNAYRLAAGHGPDKPGVGNPGRGDLQGWHH